VSLAALALCFASLAVAAPSNPIPGELIVRYRKGAGPVQRSAALARVPGAESVRQLAIVDGELVRFGGMTTNEAIDELRRDPQVLAVEPNYEIHLDAIPNDPRFPELYGLRNIGQTGGTPGADIRATQAWDLFTGDPNLKLGVIDTGIDWTHPDLVANIWTNPGEVAGNGVDDDGNGYVDDLHGYDFVNRDGDPMDDHGHGTHCSGTIAAVGDNGIGVAGVNWRLKLVGIKFLNASGSGSTAGAIEAVQYAVAAGVRLTSNSWGGGSYSDALLAAIDAAGAAGQLFVAAAGNSGVDLDVFPHYPASYDSPYIISVGATDHNDQLAGFSNYGVNGVDLAAPGVSILSTVPGSGYTTFSGTSMATPHVAGVVALAAGRFPFAGHLFLKELVLSSCDSIPTLNGLIHRSRRLNAFQPILEPDSIAPSPVDDLAVGALGSTAIGLTWTASGDDEGTGTARAYDLRWSLAPIDSGNFALATPAATGAPLPSGGTEHVEVPGLTFTTTYHFAVRVLDELGNASPISNVATGTTLGIPHIQVTPAALAQSLLTGEVATQQLTVSNTGEGRLDFVAPTPEQLFAASLAQSLEVTPDPGPGEGDPEGRPGYVGERGPDRGGYRWRSSDDPGGPAFGWVDITRTGTPVAFAGHDDLSPAVPLGFEMPFYGRKLTSVRVGSNGYLTFLGTGSWSVNVPLPSSATPADLVAPWWQDLGLGGPRSVLYRREADRFVVSYLDVPAREPEAPRRTFQVILQPSGRIVFQYLSLGWPRDRATVGIQDPSQASGLVVSYNAPFAHDLQAIEFLPVGLWLTVSPTSGRVPAGASVDVDVRFDATGLYGGDYAGAVLLDSNDPAMDRSRTPVSLHVTGAPDVAVIPDSLDYGGLFIGATRMDSVHVLNVGTQTLHVASVTCTPAVFSAPAGPLDVPPGASVVLPVSFTPTDPNAYSGSLTIASDDHDEPTISVTLSGLGLVPPDVATAPALLSANLYTGATAERTLTLSNTGGSDLSFRIRARRPAPGAAAAGTPVTASGPLAGPTPNTLSPTTGTPVVHAEYSGTHLRFGLSEVGEVMPFQYPIGNEHLALGTWHAGYTLAYEAGGTDRLAYAVYAGRLNVAPVSYQELENTAARVVVEVVSRTQDGYVGMRRRFTFVRSQKVVTVETRLENLTGQPVTNVVYKESADWDADGNFSNTWDYDRDRNLIHASFVRYVGIASEQVPSVQDLYGWNDYNRRETTVDFPNGPALGLDGLEVLHFELGTLAPAVGAQVTLAYGAGNTLAELQAVLDDAVGSPGWLRFEPAEGVVPAGEALAVSARFDATGLLGGTYPADVHVTSNDPDEPDVAFPARLQVTGVPRIAIAPDSLEFGGLFVGGTRTDSVEVSNPGSDVLHVSAVTASPSHFLAPTGPFELAPGASRTLPVTFAPTEVGAFDGTLEIASDAHDGATVSIPLHGEGFLAPDIAAIPESLSVSLFTGDIATLTLTLQNLGGSALVWTAAGVHADVLATSRTFTARGGEALIVKDGEAGVPAPVEPPAARLYVERSPAVVGPDGGATAEVAASAEGGSAVPLITLEAALASLNAGFPSVTAPIPARFDFLEGETGISIVDGGGNMYDSGNFLYGISGPLAYTNGPIVPHPSLGGLGRYFTRKYPGLFVFAADLGGANEFSVIGNLGANGLASADGAVLSATLGGVNYRGFVKRVFGTLVPSVNHLIVVADAPSANHVFDTWTDNDYHLVTGLLSCRRLYYLLFSAQSGGYLNDGVVAQVFQNFVALMNAAPPWLSVSPDSGTTSAGGESALNVRFDAAGLLGGDYRGAIAFTSNDPDETSFAVPVAMHVTGVPRLAASRASLDFGTMFAGGTRDDTLTVRNVGTDLLTVTSLTATPAEFSVSPTPFSLAPGAARTLTVSYSPTVAGESNGELTLESNDGVSPVTVVSLHGLALEPPVAAVTPDSLDFEVPQGEARQLPLTLSNTGGSELTFTVSRGAGAPAAAAPRPEDIRTSAAPPSGGRRAAVSQDAPLATFLQGPLAGLGDVLVIADGGTEVDVSAVLTAAGYTVTLVSDDSIYDGTNPPLAGFDLVVLLDGPGVLSDMPAGGQTAIANHVSGGGGLLSFEWLSFEISAGRYTLLQPLIPLTYGGYGDGTFTWSVVAAHPVTDGVSPSFNVSTTAALGTANSGTVLVRSGTGYPMVLTKQVGGGNIVHFASAGNYFGFRPFTSPDMQRLLVNAADWLTGSRLLSVAPASGSVAAHSTLELTVTAEAGTRAAGTYEARLLVTSNDPAHPTLTVPVTVVVTAAPGVAGSPEGGASGGSPSGGGVDPARDPGQGPASPRGTPGATSAPAEVTALALHGLVPNPPVRDLLVSFALPAEAPGRLELLDLAGRRLRAVDLGTFGPGRHRVSLGPTGPLGSGVYLVRLHHRGRTLVSKCVLMK
jgi:subtilisin family serine protease